MAVTQAAILLSVVLPSVSAQAQSALTVSSGVPATATSAPVAGPVVVGVIDMQRILTEASAARDVAAQRSKYLAKYQAEAVAQEKALSAEDQALAAQESSLPRDVFNSRQDAFRQKLADYQRRGQMRRSNLERAFRMAMGQLEGVIVKAASDAAATRNMTYVLYRTQVFLFDHRLDITDTVLDRVNHDLPTLAMPDPDSLPQEPEPEGQVDQMPLPTGAP